MLDYSFSVLKPPARSTELRCARPATVFFLPVNRRAVQSCVSPCNLHRPFCFCGNKKSDWRSILGASSGVMHRSRGLIWGREGVGWVCVCVGGGGGGLVSAMNRCDMW